MVRMIKVRIIGQEEAREVTLQEAERILQQTCNDPMGGLVVDARTHEAIWQISPNIEEMIIIEQMFCGG